MSEIQKEINTIEQELNQNTEELNKMKYHSDLKGIFVSKYVTCGRHDCNCMTVGEKHGPYYYIQQKKNSKISYTYLTTKKAEEMRPLYEDNKLYKKKMAHINKLKRELAHLKKIERRGIENG